jgi:hypothetical protein
MAAVLALVSKGEFDKQHRGAAMGQVLAIAAYNSSNAGLRSLADGGDLYLVTVRPGDELWLVGVLRGPKQAKDRWTSEPNAVPVTLATPVIPKLRFASGKGLAVEPGKLGMSLQTPRALTDEDVRVLEQLIAGGDQPAAAAPASAPASTTQASTTQASAKPSTKKSATQASVAIAPWAACVSRRART